MMTRTAGLELHHFELTAEESRCINENVVVRGIVTITFSFQARISLPSSRNVVFDAARHMLLTDNVHETRRRCDVRHLIVQQSRTVLVMHVDVVGSWFGNAPRLLIRLLPIQWLIAHVDSTEFLNVARVVFDTIHTG